MNANGTETTIIANSAEENRRLKASFSTATIKPSAARGISTTAK
jgi:hypothetical protein